MLLLAAGCDSGWGPPRDVSRFQDAAIAGEAPLGVFTYKHRIYRPASGWQAFPDGGPSRDLINENGIASYDPKSGEVKVLWRQNVMESRWLPAASCSVEAVAGGRALALCSGQRRSDYRFGSERFWIDIATAETSPLPLEKELAARGRELLYLYLLDEAGTLALVLPLPEHPQESRKLEPVRELLIRRPSGDYRRVGEIIHYYGLHDGEVHFWSVDNRHRAYRLDDGRVRDAAYREYLALSEKGMAGPERTFAVLFRDGKWRLRFGRKVEEKWEYEILPLTVAEVAGGTD